MEVDRIWRIDGLDGQANPAWQDSARRRRRFVEEIAEATEESDDDREESSPAVQPLTQDPERFSAAEDSNPAATSPKSGASFHVTV